MTVLLPRLDSREASKLRTVYLTSERSFSQKVLEDMMQHRSVFPATGGLRITLEQLLKFRDQCITSVKDAEKTTNFESTFDINIGTQLGNFGQSNRSDMGVAGVWDFMTLVLLPDLVAKRLGNVPSDSSGLRSRITGGDRRHQLQRLWKRRMVLGNALVDARLLTEDDYVQLLERNITLERGELTRRVAHLITSLEISGEKRREYARTMMKSLLQMSGLVHFDEAESRHLDASVEELHRWTLARLGDADTPATFETPLAMTDEIRMNRLALKKH